MESAEEGEEGERMVSDLRSELWVKERELTDIRLEALNSAHQLEQLRDAMNSMQVCLRPVSHTSQWKRTVIIFLFCYSRQWIPSKRRMTT